LEIEVRFRGNSNRARLKTPAHPDPPLRGR
jgi:hypothetical protein